MKRRPRAPAFLFGVAALTVLLMGSLVWVALDASARRAADRPHAAPRRALIAATGLSDPFFSSGSRWLRHPSLTEPGAPLADGPDGLDVDPGGMAIGGYDGAHEPGPRLLRR